MVVSRTTLSRLAKEARLREALVKVQHNKQVDLGSNKASNKVVLVETQVDLVNKPLREIHLPLDNRILADLVEVEVPLEVVADLARLVEQEEDLEPQQQVVQLDLVARRLELAGLVAEVLLLATPLVAVDLEQLNQRLEVVLLVDLAMPRHLREVLLALPPQEGPLRASEAQAVVEASVEAQ